MTNVYILTKEGRTYSTEGLNYVKNQIETNYNITDELLFNQGAVHNNATQFVETLKNEKTTPVIALSTNDGIAIFTGEHNINTAITHLTENPNTSSWETLTTMAYAQRNNS